MIGESHTEMDFGRVFVHLSFLDYESIYVGHMNEPRIIKKMMLPNISFDYIYTVNGEPIWSLTDKYKPFT